jgi:predicted metal-binding membrane protein
MHWSHAGADLAAATLGWTVMMGVMMAPTVTPWIATYHRFGTAALPATVLFATGYLVVWAAFGFIVSVVRGVAPAPAGYERAVLVAAGLFQFTALKQACLSHCRNPFSFMLARWKDGPASAFHLGASHGLYCVGCCWALMLTMFAVSIASAWWWMAALAAATYVEQGVSWGARVRVPVGLALIAAGFLR